MSLNPGRAAAMFSGVPSSVTGCKVETPKNMAAALPGMTLQPLYLILAIVISKGA